VDESCSYCHEKKYKGRLNEWKMTIATHLMKAEVAFANNIAAVRKAKLSKMDELRARRLLDDALHNITFVKLGHGVHNVNYSTAMLNMSLEYCRKVEAILTSDGKGTETTP